MSGAGHVALERLHDFFAEDTWEFKLASLYAAASNVTGCVYDLSTGKCTE